jgi:exodeoxyribonuclease V gamma subunit
MLEIHRGNRLETLGEALIEDLRAGFARGTAADGGGLDPFDPIRIAVGNRGVREWLREAIARGLGACFQVDFPTPAPLLADIARGLDGDAGGGRGRGVERPAVPVADPWDPETLAWELLRAWGRHPDEPALERLFAYFARDPALPGGGAAPDPADAPAGPPPVTRRRWMLARQVGDLLDRYAMFRPEMLRSWLDGVEAAGTEHPWQSWSWRAIAAGRDVGTHPVFRMIRLTERMAEIPAERLPRRPVRLFGLTSLPPVWVRFLAALAARVPVRMYLPAGSVLAEEVRDDAREPSPLWIKCGRPVRAFFAVAAQARARFTDRFDPPDAAAPTTVLARLQREIRHGCGPDGPFPIDAGDDSIRLHACHGPARQVEVLRDALLHLFARHPDLQPRDVVVMTPDIGTYAPLVESVFGDGPDRPAADGDDRWGEAGAPRLPVAVTDQSLRRLNPVADVLLRLLDLAGGRVAASSVLDLLGLEPVRRRFGLGAEPFARVRALLVAAGVRWGIDADDRAEAGQPRDGQNSWAFAIDRLLLGRVVGAADRDRLLRIGDRARDLYGEPHAGFAPLDPGDDFPAIGRTIEALAVLFDARRALRDPRPLATWAADLAGGDAGGRIGRLVEVLRDEEWMLRQVREVLAEAVAAAAETDLPVAREALAEILRGKLEIADWRRSVEADAIVVSSMAPMRSVPRRVVCLLGIDDGVFPRAPIAPAYDLVAANPRPGDRDARAEDRLVFLEAITSAQDHLIVLFAGRSVHTNEPREPAVPVAELRDELDRRFVAAGRPGGATLVREHPLQPFSPRAFSPSGPGAPDPSPWSFDRRLLRGVRAAAAGEMTDIGPIPVLDKADSERVVEVQELIRFLKYPTGTFAREAFGMLYPWGDEGTPIEDREPVEGLGVRAREAAAALLPAAREAWAGVRGVAEEEAAAVAATTAAPAFRERLSWYERRLRAEGVCGIGETFGRAGYEWLAEGVATWVACHEPELEAFGAESAPAFARWSSGSVRVEGEVRGLRGRRLTVDQPWVSTFDLGRAWEGWVTLLFAACAGRGVAGEGAWRLEVRGLSERDRKMKPWTVCFEPSVPAGDLLRDLVRLWGEGVRRPLPLFGRASSVFADRLSGRWREAGEVGSEALSALTAASVEGEERFTSVWRGLAAREGLAAGAREALRWAARAFRRPVGNDRGFCDADDAAVAWIWGDRLFVEGGAWLETSGGGEAEASFAASSWRAFGPLCAASVTS